MAIFKPEVVKKRMSTQSGVYEDGAEVYLLSDEDMQHNFRKDFFQIKLGYNGIHHYFPIIPKGIMQFMDSVNSVTHYSVNLRKVLKALSDQSPRDTPFQKLVSIAHQNLVATTTVLSGLNPLTGATGTARTATPADFGFPVGSTEPSSSGKSSSRGEVKRGAWTLELKKTGIMKKRNRRKKRMMIQSSNKILRQMILQKSQ